MSIYRQVAHRALMMLLLLLLGVFLSVSVQAQQATPAAEPTANAVTPQDLAKAAHNPFEDAIKVPFQSTTGFSLGRNHNAGESLNIAPVLPFRLNGELDLIAEPSLSVTYLPSPHEQFGLQDLQTSFFFTPHNAQEWLWGIGPIFQFPSRKSRCR